MAEKGKVVHGDQFEFIDAQDSEMGASSTEQTTAAYDEAETKRILRKVDIRLIPCLALLYLLSFMDRGNSKEPYIAAVSRNF